MLGTNASHTSLPPEFLEWQVALRHETAMHHGGAPHVGVAPLVLVPRSGLATGVAAHSIICGLLPHERLLESKTEEFRGLYEGHVADGARAVYDAGLEYLKAYYEKTEDFDPVSITTLLHEDLPLVDALRHAKACALVFYVFNLTSREPTARLRCLHVDCSVSILDEGPVFDNVWYHNTLFHGPADDHVVVHFRHRASWDTRFGGFEEQRS